MRKFKIENTNVISIKYYLMQNINRLLVDVDSPCVTVGYRFTLEDAYNRIHDMYHKLKNTSCDPTILDMLKSALGIVSANPDADTLEFIKGHGMKEYHDFEDYVYDILEYIDTKYLYKI